jgi:alpha-glucosidase (family GH31 glycosyl hydrolase)
LFPDYQAFLKKIKAKNLRITLNLHPADGIRFWDNAYEEMAQAFGVNPETKEYIPFDIADANFINRYFSILHKPYEKSGVDFWWVDWQQGISSKMEGLDPLWALNHYHYLDIAVNNIPLILSRYSGIGSHRYPVGFSGDTYVTWETLKYLPYFTANASNIGYTWWSHDIGGHQAGYMENELYVRFIQYGVFSPINRLHCSNSETMTKEPWAYNNGAGAISKEYLRFRHRMIPYLYSASYKTHKDGLALIEPLYYQWDNEEAYLFNEEYLFGGELLLAPITEKAIDGFACVNAWIPEGKWTDIFTGDGYQAGPEGKTVTLLRELEFIPVLAREGAILPLSMEPGNSIMNPEKLEIWSYLGNNEYILYEDGILEQKQGEFFTILNPSIKK